MTELWSTNMLYPSIQLPATPSYTSVSSIDIYVVISMVSSGMQNTSSGLQLFFAILNYFIRLIYPLGRPAKVSSTVTVWRRTMVEEFTKSAPKGRRRAPTAERHRFVAYGTSFSRIISRVHPDTGRCLACGIDTLGNDVCYNVTTYAISLVTPPCGTTRN